MRGEGRGRTPVAIARALRGRRDRRWLGILGALCLLLGRGEGRSRADDSRAGAACAAAETSLAIQGHRLYLCQGGRVEQSFAISLGRGGLGKRSDGDGKTPTGTYPLGRPRKSSRFGLFIPVGYPTAAQRGQGFTGGDIGVHGPKRRWSWLGRAANLVDWTRGCIALNRDSEIAAVAEWVTRQRPQTIHILGD